MADLHGQLALNLMIKFHGKLLGWPLALILALNAHLTPTFVT